MAGVAFGSLGAHLVWNVRESGRPSVFLFCLGGFCLPESRPRVRPTVRPSVRPSVRWFCMFLLLLGSRPRVGPSVRPSVRSSVRRRGMFF